MPLDSLAAPLAAFLAPAGPLAPAPAQFHGAGEARTTIYAGVHWLRDEFDPAQDQTILGIALDVREPGGRASFEAGYFRSFGDGSTRIGATSVDVDSCVHELWVGGRWSFDPWDNRFHPYVGGGLSAMYAEYETQVPGAHDSDTGWAIGAYGHGGIEWDLGGGWAVGLDLRMLVSTSATLQEKVPLDYVQPALTLSWTW